MDDTDNGLSGRAYEYAHNVLPEAGIIEGLASVHRIGLNNRDDEVERRGVGLAAYRTVAIGGALAARFMDAHLRPRKDISQAF